MKTQIEKIGGIDVITFTQDNQTFILEEYGVDIDDLQILKENLNKAFKKYEKEIINKNLPKFNEILDKAYDYAKYMWEASGNGTFTTLKYAKNDFIAGVKWIMDLLNQNE
jgi:hypothetical protein